MYFFLDIFHQGGKYTAQIYIHQAELRRKGNFTDQKYLSNTYLQTDYIKLDSGSGFGKHGERENIVQTKFTFFGGATHSAEICFKSIRKDK